MRPLPQSIEGSDSDLSSLAEGSHTCVSTAQGAVDLGGVLW